MREYDLFIPLFYNDGAPVEPRVFQQLQQRLLGEFGGVTFFSQPNKGVWRLGEVTFHDEIVIYRVLSDKAQRSRRFLVRLKKELLSRLKQEEILVVERKVRTL